MNYWLLTVCIAAPFTLLVANFSIVQAWGAKAEEANILPKFLVVLGLTFAECSVLLLPIDVSNAPGSIGCGVWNQLCGGLGKEPKGTIF